MPELPDVEVFLDRAQAGLRRPVSDVTVDGTNMLVDVSAGSVQRGLRGRELVGARRHGKHLFLEIDGENQWLWLHFGMTGEVRVYEEADEEPPYTRLRLDFEDGGHLAFTSKRRLGKIGLVADPVAFLEEHDLGPDPWNDPPDRDAFHAILTGRRSAGIKSALMNQEVIAGLGNVYVDEILFQTKVHPETPIRDLDDATIEAIRQSMAKVLHKAVEAQADPKRMPRTWLPPNRMEGDCPRCDGKIVRTRVAGRSTYWCDTHQRRAG